MKKYILAVWLVLAFVGISFAGPPCIPPDALLNQDNTWTGEQTFIDSLNVSGDTEPQLVVGRDTDGYVSVLLERRYVGKFDWLIKNEGDLGFYGDDGAGSSPTTLRFRINDDGSVDAIYGLRAGGFLGVGGDISTEGLVFEDGQTGDSWYWIGTDSDNGADDDEPLMIGKGNTIGTTPYVAISPNGKVGIGTTTPTANNLDLTTLGGNSELYLVSYKNDNTRYPIMRFRKSHSNTLADVETINTEYLGRWQIEGENTTPAFAPGNRFYVQQSGASGAFVPAKAHWESADADCLFVDQFVISDDRRIGVNTEDPTATLHILGDLYTPLTGTVTAVQGSPTIEGAGTSFNTELVAGDSVRILSDTSLMVGYEIFTVLSVTDADTLTLDSNYLGSGVAGVTMWKDSNLLKLANGEGVEKFSVSKDGDTTISGFHQDSVTTGITATNPGAQGDNVLASTINEISVVGTAADAVTLPPAVAGRHIYIVNNDAADSLEIWPNTDDDCGAGANTAINLAAGSNLHLIAINGVTWEAF